VGSDRVGIDPFLFISRKGRLVEGLGCAAQVNTHTKGPTTHIALFQCVITSKISRTKRHMCIASWLVTALGSAVPCIGVGRVHFRCFRFTFFRERKLDLNYYFGIRS